MDLHVRHDVFIHWGEPGSAIRDQLDRIEEQLVTLRDELHAAQDAGTLAIDQLGDLIVAETDQVQQILQELVDAQGNGVTAEDVAAAVASVDRLRAAGEAVKTIAPDAAPDPGPDPDPNG